MSHGQLTAHEEYQGRDDDVAADLAHWIAVLDRPMSRRDRTLTTQDIIAAMRHRGRDGSERISSASSTDGTNESK